MVSVEWPENRCPQCGTVHPLLPSRGMSDTAHYALGHCSECGRKAGDDHMPLCKWHSAREAQNDSPITHWLIFYDDADMKPEMFGGEGAEAAARHRYEIIRDNWNAHLFAKVNSNSQDAYVREAQNAAPQRPAMTTPPSNNYRCGHCGYEGPCYGAAGSRVSAPWCRQCQMNDKLTPVVPPSDAAAEDIVERLRAVSCTLKADIPVRDEAADTIAALRPLADIGREWRENSSLEKWFPFTAEELTRLRAQVEELERARDKVIAQRNRWDEACQQAKAESDALRKDAERYRWYRLNPAWETEAYLSAVIPEVIDADIDSMMEQK